MKEEPVLTFLLHEEEEDNDYLIQMSRKKRKRESCFKEYITEPHVFQCSFCKFYHCIIDWRVGIDQLN